MEMKKISFLLLLLLSFINISLSINYDNRNINSKINGYTSGGFDSTGDLKSSGVNSGGSGYSTSASGSLTGNADYTTANHPAHDTGSGSTTNGVNILYNVCLYADSNCKSYQKICVVAKQDQCTPILSPGNKQTVWTMPSSQYDIDFFSNFRCTVFNRTNSVYQNCGDCSYLQNINSYVSFCQTS